MARERTAAKEKPRKREKKVSDDKVIKKGKQKKRVATPVDSSDDESTGGAAVDVESSEDTPMGGSLGPVETKSKDDKKTKKEKKLKKETQAEAEAEANDDTAEGGAMLFSIDTNPTPVDLTAVKTITAEDEKDGKIAKEKGPTQTQPPSGLTRVARRRIMMIERQRELIKGKMGIPADSQEKDNEVQEKLDEWIKAFDEKNEVRMEKKNRRKAKEQTRLKNKRGKVLTGRKLKEREKQIKSAEKKAAKKAAKKSGISATN
ncbi:hypothetical protein NUW58_g3294 [Xylaria curta]|uniref:Uncharacterized protein n=1 Tax=Xylaria curta TaxID=42375 RepID=A0ACC1PD64_9PEZI|nr:hypothetical protein NUW58_g3294 [Xylaria curta]